MGFSEAFPELDFQRAQAIENREKDNKCRRWREKKRLCGVEKVFSAVMPPVCIQQWVLLGVNRNISAIWTHRKP